jgi:hypothetical protein
MKDAVQFAEKSAASAKKHSVTLSNGKKVLSEALTKIDRLREEIDALRQKESSSFSQIKQTLPELEHFDETTEDEPPPETVSDSEAAEVAAQLAGKITTTGREG